MEKENDLKFEIHQISLNPRNPDKARELLFDLGLTDWFVDTISSHGSVYGKDGCENRSVVYSTYDADDCSLTRTPVDLEIMKSLSGENWMDRKSASVSHLGMYVTEEQLDRFRIYFNGKWIAVAQEIFTDYHSNTHINEKYRFHTVTFDTRDILGVDLMFIVRMEL
jgi:hypothetical protein